MNLAENLKRQRKAHGYSQKELGEKVGVHQTMIANIEAGFKVPSVRVCLDLAKTLNTTVEALCEGVQQ